MTMSVALFGVRASRVDGLLDVYVSGELDASTAPRLRERMVEELRDGCREARVDLSGVWFCDASGLSALAAASRCAGLLHQRFRIVGPRPHLSRLLSVTGLEQALDVPRRPPDTTTSDVPTPGGCRLRTARRGGFASRT